MSSGNDVRPGIWTIVEFCLGITSACLPTLGPVVSYIIHGSAAAQGLSKKPFISDQRTPNSNSKKTASSKISWPDFKMRESESSKGGESFTQLELSQDDVEGSWTPIAPFSQTHRAEHRGVEMSAMRSSSGGVEGQPSDGIKVTIAMEQGASKSARGLIS